MVPSAALLEDVMDRFYVTFETSARTERGGIDREATEAIVDATLDRLLERREVIDPDAGAEMSGGRVEFMMMVEAKTPEQAVTDVGELLRRCVGSALERAPGMVVEFTAATAVEQSTIPAAS